MTSSFVDRGGVTRLARRFRGIATLTEKETVKTLEDIGEDLKRKSQAVVPYDEGDLHDSAYVNRSSENGNPYVEVGYRAPYALYVHEQIHGSYQGPPVNYTTPGTGGKYLENPYLQERGRYAEMLKDAGRRPIRG